MQRSVAKSSALPFLRLRHVVYLLLDEVFTRQDPRRQADVSNLISSNLISSKVLDVSSSTILRLRQASPSAMARMREPPGMNNRFSDRSA